MAKANKSGNFTSEDNMDYMNNYRFPKNDNINAYDSFKKIKDISFGMVYKAVEKNNKTNVAIKKILFEDDKENMGFPIQTIQEIATLKALRHENIIDLINICNDRRNDDDGTHRVPSVYLIFEYCEYDLAMLLSNSNIIFGLDEIKLIMKQILTGVNFMHSKMFIHNNIKPSHILVNKQGIIKLCDFQFSKIIPLQSSLGQPEYVTRWYQSPELLLGERNYTTKVDMWSVGCVMAELWTKVPILNGTSEQNQLELISKLCGSITPDVWPNVQKCPLFKKMILPQNLKNQIKETFPPIGQDENAIALLENFLILNPLTRIDAETALNHSFFSTLDNTKSLETILSDLKIE